MHFEDKDFIDKIKRNRVFRIAIPRKYDELSQYQQTILESPKNLKVLTPKKNYSRNSSEQLPQVASTSKSPSTLSPNTRSYMNAISDMPTPKRMKTSRCLFSTNKDKHILQLKSVINKQKDKLRQKI